jgi:hypothetical protein
MDNLIEEVDDIKNLATMSKEELAYMCINRAEKMATMWSFITNTCYAEGVTKCLNHLEARRPMIDKRTDKRFDQYSELVKIAKETGTGKLKGSNEHTDLILKQQQEFLANNLNSY